MPRIPKALPKAKPRPPKAREWYVRKRDKTVVRVETVGKLITYCTMPLLMVYDASKDTFHKNFRLASSEEIEPYKDALP